MKTCPICNSSNLVRYPYNNHNKVTKRFLKYCIVLILLPILKLKIFQNNTVIQNLCNWVKEDSLFSLRFNISRCLKCGYGVYDRRLDLGLLGKYYNNRFQPLPFAISADQWHNKSIYREDSRSIGQYNFVKDKLSRFSKINMLEIGAGAALFPRLLRENHPGEVLLNVVEPSDYWKPYYQALDIKLVAEYFPFESSQKFDYIHVSFCLLCIYDLSDAISKLKNLLTENGLLFIDDQNFNSDYYSLDYIDTPRINFLTKESLVTLMKKNNLEVLQIQEYGLTSKEQFLKQNSTEKNLNKESLEQANTSIRENIAREGGNCLRGLFSLKSSA